MVILEDKLVPRNLKDFKEIHDLYKDNRFLYVDDNGSPRKVELNQIYAHQIKSDWLAKHGPAEILNKPELGEISKKDKIG